MDFEPQTMRRVDTDIGNAKVLDQNRVMRCLTSERESRLFACGSKIQKLLIFPFLVRTNDEGVFRAFFAWRECRFARDCEGAELDFRLIGDQSGTIRVSFS